MTEPPGVEDLAAARERRDRAPAIPRLVTASEFVSISRPPIKPYVETAGGRSAVLLARESMLLVAGPSGVGKSLAASFDLGGRLAADQHSEWLGLRVCGGLRVALLALEGGDEETAEWIARLVPVDARDRFALLDRWRGSRLSAADAHREQLASLIAKHSTDVVIIDTAAAFFAGRFDISKGVPEEAFEVLQDLRARARSPFACIVVAHTRKADRRGGRVDELEEIAGTFGRKADAAIVMRRDGHEGLRRVIRFAKVRRGPEPLPITVTFPGDDTEPPRLVVVGEPGDVAIEDHDADLDGRVVAYVTGQAPATKTAIRHNVRGQAKRIDESIARLVAGGQLAKGPKGYVTCPGVPDRSRQVGQDTPSEWGEGVSVLSAPIGGGQRDTIDAEAVPDDRLQLELDLPESPG